MGNCDLKVIMPTYNESGSISRVVSEWLIQLKKLGIKFEIHVYNDGSKDQTLKILRKLQSCYSQLVIHSGPNKGHGPTLIQGYSENLDADWIFQTDSDGEIESHHLEEFWNSRHNFDLIVGVRINRKQSLMRKISTWMSRLVVWILFSPRVKDVNCPYRLMRSESIRAVVAQMNKNLFAPNILISGYMGKTNKRIKQVPVEHIGRLSGEVSLKSFKLLKSLFKALYETMLFAWRPE